MKLVLPFARQVIGAKRILLAFTLAMSAIFGGENAANAQVVSIWVNDFDNGWQNIASATSPGQASSSVYYTLNGMFKLSGSVASMIDSTSADINNSTFHIQRIGDGASSMQIAVIGSSFTTPYASPISVESQVTGTNNGGLTALTFQSYIDQSNNADPSKLVGGIGLQSPVIQDAILDDLKTVLNSNLNNPWSMAHVFTFTMTSDGDVVSLTGDTTLNPNGGGPGVPEPSSFALVGMCLTGFGGYRWSRRRQRTVTELSSATSA
jgi:hypothetical protein